MPKPDTHVGMSYATAADQSRMMQEQMTGAAMAMPADTNKAFKVRLLLLPADLEPSKALPLEGHCPEVSG